MLRCCEWLFLEGKTLEETADELGTTLAAVFSLTEENSPCSLAEALQQELITIVKKTRSRWVVNSPDCLYTASWPELIGQAQARWALQNRQTFRPIS